MFCPNCGKANPDGAVFCGSCGQKMPVVAPLNPNPTVQPNQYANKQQNPTQNKPAQAPVRPMQPKPKKKFNILLVIIPLLLLVLFVVAIIAGVIIWKVVGGSRSSPVVPVYPTEPVSEYIGEIESPTEVVRASYSTYRVVKSDATWTSANSAALNDDGELASINSYEEFNTVCNLADDMGLKVFWIGAKRTYYSWEDTNWLDGSPMNYTNWYSGEPTYQSEEGNQENYLMVFKVKDKWYFNDAENDVSQYYKGKMGYIIEYVNYY